MRNLVLLTILLVINCSLSAQEKVDFNRDIRPILSDKCFFCHGPDKNHRAADLRLDVEADAKDWVIVEHDPDDSELISRIETDEAMDKMPPAKSGKKLTEVEIKLLRDWGGTRCEMVRSLGLCCAQEKRDTGT